MFSCHPAVETHGLCEIPMAMSQTVFNLVFLVQHSKERIKSNKSVRIQRQGIFFCMNFLMLVCFLDVFLRWIITVLGMYEEYNYGRVGGVGFRVFLNFKGPFHYLQVLRLICLYAYMYVQKSIYIKCFPLKISSDIIKPNHNVLSINTKIPKFFSECVKTCIHF